MRSTGKSSSTRRSTSGGGRLPRQVSRLCARESHPGRTVVAADRGPVAPGQLRRRRRAGRDDLAGRSDPIILQVACSEGRAVVTNNIKDFCPLAAEWLAQGRVHAGLIRLSSTRTRTRNAIAAVAAAIENVLRDHPDGLSGSERWIAPLPNV